MAILRVAIAGVNWVNRTLALSVQQRDIQGRWTTVRFVWVDLSPEDPTDLGIVLLELV